MYESMQRELSNKLEMADARSRVEAQKGQQIAGAVNALTDAVTQGMSTYAQTKINNQKYDLRQELLNGEQEYLNVDNENASQDYAAWAESRLDSWAEKQGSLVKGFFGDTKQQLLTEARNDFDTNLINTIAERNAFNAQQSWDKIISTALTGGDVSALDSGYVYTTSFEDGGLKVKYDKVKVENLFETESDNPTSEQEYFTDVCNALYISQCGIMSQDKARTLVDSKKYEIEQALTHGDILTMVDEIAERGHEYEPGKFEFYTAEELKAWVKSQYLEGNKRTYLDGEYSEEEAKELADYIDKQVETKYAKMYARSFDVINNDMREWWIENEQASELVPDLVWKKLEDEGLIAIDANGNIDHHKIDDSTWNTLYKKVEFNKHLKAASDFIDNPVDLTGDNVIDGFDLEKIDPDAVKFFRYDQNLRMMYVDPNVGFQQWTTNEEKLAPSSREYLIRKNTPEDLEGQNFNLGAAIYGIELDENGNQVSTGHGAIDYKRALVLADANMYDALDVYAREMSKDISGKEWTELTASEMRSVREQTRKMLEVSIDNILSESYKYVDENGQWASTKEKAQERLDAEVGYTIDQITQQMNAQLRQYENDLYKSLYVLDTLALDPHIDYSIGNSLTEKLVLNDTLSYLNEACKTYGVEVKYPTADESKFLKNKCEELGLDYSTVSKVYAISLTASYLSGVGLTEGMSQSEFLERVLTSDTEIAPAVLNSVKETLKDKYESNVASVESTDLWKKNKGEYLGSKSFSDIDKSASNDINYEVYNRNSIDYIKPKKSKDGQLQMWMNLVASGTYSLEYAQAIALSDTDLSQKDTELFCGKADNVASMKDFLTLYTQNAYIADNADKIISGYSRVHGETQVFETILNGIYGLGVDATPDEVEKAFKRIESDLSVTLGTQISTGLKSDKKDESTYAFNKGSNYKKELTESIDLSKQKLKDSSNYNIAHGVVDTYLNGKNIDVEAFQSSFNSLDKTGDATRKTNLLLKNALLACDLKADDLDVNDPEFIDKLEKRFDELGLRDGDVNVIIDVAAELSNWADNFTEAKAKTKGVPERRDSTSSVYDSSTGLTLADDGNTAIGKDGSRINLDFLGNEINNHDDYDYAPVRNAITEQTNELLEKDEIWQTMNRLAMSGFTVMEGDDEFIKIQNDFMTKTTMFDDYSGNATREELDAFFAKYPDSPFKEKYDSSDDLYNFFLDVINERRSTFIESDFLDKYAKQRATETTAWQEYYGNKESLESPNFTDKAVWILPDMKIETDGHGYVMDTVKIDRGTTDAVETATKSDVDTVKDYINTTDSKTVQIKIPSEDGYKLVDVKTEDAKQMLKGGQHYVYNGKWYSSKKFKEMIVVPEEY